jgi:uncharacterized membrane protein YdjX (TVP38/TMEM64 family)
VPIASVVTEARDVVVLQREMLAVARQAARAVPDPERPFRLQFLLRLTPLNAASLTYVAGAAGVRFAGFLLAFIGLIPHLLMEVYLGYAGHQLTRLGAAAKPPSFAHEIVALSGLIVSAVVVFAISRIAHKAIERALDAGGA